MPLSLPTVYSLLELFPNQDLDIEDFKTCVQNMQKESSLQLSSKITLKLESRLVLETLILHQKSDDKRTLKAKAIIKVLLIRLN